MRRRGRNRTDDGGFGDLSDTISPRAHVLNMILKIPQKIKTRTK